MMIGFKQCKTLEPHYSPILTKLVIRTVGDKKRNPTLLNQTNQCFGPKQPKIKHNLCGNHYFSVVR